MHVWIECLLLFFISTNHAIYLLLHLQHSKKDKIRSSKKADTMDSDVNDHDEQLLRLLKK